jgi:hypothetical protein
VECTPGEEAQAPDVPPATEGQWTLQQADAAPFLALSTGEVERRDNSYELNCYGSFSLTNTHPTNGVEVEIERYNFIRGYRDETSVDRYVLDPGERADFQLVYNYNLESLAHHTYVTRLVGFVAGQGGYVNPATEWIPQTWPSPGTLLTSGLTIIVPPNPCAP